MYIGSKIVYREKYRWALIVLAALPLFLVAGLRYGIGTDYFSYVDIYRSSSREYSGKIEPLYYLLNHVLNKIGLGEQWIFIACAAIYVFVIYTYAYKESPNPIFSIYLFVTMTFYLSFFNTMRQNLACAILLLAIPYVRKKKLIPFLIAVTIAGLIHLSSFAFVFIYLFAHIKLTPKKVIVIAVAFLALRGLVVQQIVNIIMNNPNLDYEKYLDEIGNIYKLENTLKSFDNKINTTKEQIAYNEKQLIDIKEDLAYQIFWEYWFNWQY